MDCIIVGAGPSGGSAAYHLAKRGHRVLVLEKAPLPRYKPCGGGVSPAVAQWFDFDFSPVISATVNRVQFTWQQKDPVDVTLKTEPMWMVRRDRFDAFLLEKAQEAGAEVQDETEVKNLQFDGAKWQIESDRGTFEATYLIAADGSRGVCAGLLGFKNRLTLAGGVLEVNATPEATNAAGFDFGSVKNGFIWNFPKADSHAISATFMTGKGKPEDLRKQLNAYARKRGIEESQSTYYDCPTILWGDDGIFHSQNAVLAGDAAGLADPLLAEGIRPAMLSGVQAAEAVAKALGGDVEAIARYSQILQTEWGNDMNFAQKLAGLFYKFPGMAYKIGVKRQAAANIMSQILCGERRYSDVTEQAIKFLRKKILGMGG